MTTPDTTIDANIRGLSERLYRRLKAEAALRDVTIAELLNEILAAWLASAVGEGRD